MLLRSTQLPLRWQQQGTARYRLTNAARVARVQHQTAVTQEADAAPEPAKASPEASAKPASPTPAPVPAPKQASSAPEQSDEWGETTLPAEWQDVTVQAQSRQGVWFLTFVIVVLSAITWQISRFVARANANGWWPWQKGQATATAAPQQQDTRSRRSTQLASKLERMQSASSGAGASTGAILAATDSGKDGSKGSQDAAGSAAATTDTAAAAVAAAGAVGASDTQARGGRTSSSGAQVSDTATTDESRSRTPGTLPHTQHYQSHTTQHAHTHTGSSSSEAVRHYDGTPGPMPGSSRTGRGYSPEPTDYPFSDTNNNTATWGTMGNDPYSLTNKGGSTWDSYISPQTSTSKGLSGGASMAGVIGDGGRVSREGVGGGYGSRGAAARRGGDAAGEDAPLPPVRVTPAPIPALARAVEPAALDKLSEEETVNAWRERAAVAWKAAAAAGEASQRASAYAAAASSAASRAAEEAERAAAAAATAQYRLDDAAEEVFAAYEQRAIKAAAAAKEAESRAASAAAVATSYEDMGRTQASLAERAAKVPKPAPAAKEGHFLGSIQSLIKSAVDGVMHHVHPNSGT